MRALYYTMNTIAALTACFCGCLMDAPEEIFKPAFIALAISIGWLALAGWLAERRRHG